MSAFVEQRAKDTGLTQNRVIINGLASLNHLEKLRDFGEVVDNLKIIVARQDARVAVDGLKDDLLRTIKQAVKAHTAGDIGELQALMKTAGVILAGLEKQERVAK